jgi:hypothetical protein
MTMPIPMLTPLPALSPAAWMPPVLAQRGDWVELVIYAVGLVIVVGGWVANQYRQMRAEQERRRKIAELEASEQRGPGRPGDRGVQPMPTQDDLARRRRQQLAELARRRGEADEEVDEPAGLSPHEALQRRRAREAYERRAESLRRQQTAAEREGQDAARIEQQREQHRRELAQQAHRQRELQRQMQRRGRAEAPSRPAPAVAAPPAMAPARHATPTEPAPRRPQPPMPPVASTAFAVGAMDLRALRRAIVLKEILDSPVALREPIDASLLRHS